MSHLHPEKLKPMVTHRIPAARATARRPTSRHVVDRLAAVPRRRLVLVLATLILLVLVLGYVSLRTGRIGELWGIDSDLRLRWPPWDSRVNFPALISSGILGCAGLAWWRVGSSSDTRALRLGARGVGVFLGFMAINETVMIHERLAESLQMDWQLIYAPLFLAAGLLALTMLTQLRRRGHSAPAWLFVLGGACWVAAQTLEQLQFGPGHVRVDGYWVYVFVEETLENIGSSLLLLGGLSAVIRARAKPVAGQAH